MSVLVPVRAGPDLNSQLPSLGSNTTSTVRHFRLLQTEISHSRLSSPTAFFPPYFLFNCTVNLTCSKLKTTTTTTKTVPGVFSYVIQLANHMRNIGTNHLKSNFFFSHDFKSNIKTYLKSLNIYVDM